MISYIYNSCTDRYFSAETVKMRKVDREPKVVPNAQLVWSLVCVCVRMHARLCAYEMCMYVYISMFYVHV